MHKHKMILLSKTIVVNVLYFSFIVMFFIELSPNVSAITLTADFNSDNAVNDTDRQTLIANWHKTSATKPMGNANPGIDDTIDINDLSILAGQWMQSTGGQPANSINVKNAPYSAKGDGTTDDTTALTNAFNAAVSQNKLAWIPNGTYALNTSTVLTLPNNVQITGEGSSAWLKGRIYMSTGNKLSNFSIGIDGFDTRFTQASPVVNYVADHITFKGGGGTGQAVLRIDSGEALSYSSFNDCIIETNPDGVGNGISIVDNGVPTSTLHDVMFARLHIKPQPRMGFEMIGREYWGTRTTDYYNISIIDSTIEAVGAESISFDGPGNHLLVKGTHFLGSNSSDLYSWHQGLEFNGSSYASAINNVFDRQRSWWLNMHCTSCTFSGNTFNSSVDTIGQTVGSGVQAWGGVVTNSTFSNNVVIMNTGAGFMYFTGSTGNTFTNNLFVEKRSTAQTIYLISASSGNSFSGNTFCGPTPGYNFSDANDLNAIKTSTFVSNCTERQ